MQVTFYHSEGLRMHHINAEGKKRHVKHYLTSLRKMQESMHLKEDRIARLRVQLEGMSSAMGESVSGGERRDLAEATQELSELVDEYMGDLSRYASDIAEGYRLCPVEDPARHACWLHWAEGLTWAQVGRKLNYDADYVRQDICDLGVKRLYGIMPRKFRESCPEEAI